MDEKSPLCGMTFVSKVHTHAALREDLRNKCVHSESAVHYIPLMLRCLTSCQERAAEQHATYLCNAELGAHSSIGVCAHNSCGGFLCFD